MSESGEGFFTRVIAGGTVALVLLTYVLTAATLHWWPFEEQNPRLGAAASCSFLYGSVMTCSSYNSRVIVNFLSTDTTGCTFYDEVQWGDGSAPQDVTLDGGSTGSIFLASHNYTSPGTYSINVSGTISGPCSGGPATFNFTLLGS
jgi:hypothetical protein